MVSHRNPLTLFLYCWCVALIIGGCGTGSDLQYPDLNPADSVGPKETANSTTPINPPSLIEDLSPTEQKKNLKEVSERLIQCKKDDSSLPLIETSMENCCSVNSMDPTQSSKKDVAKNLIKKTFKKLLSKGFETELRMQVLKDAIVTHREFELRYSRDSTGKRALKRESTLVDEFCKDRDGNTICNASERETLLKTVRNYDDYFKKNPWTLTVDQVAQELEPLMAPFKKKMSQRQSLGMKILDRESKIKQKKGQDETWSMGMKLRESRIMNIQTLLFPDQALEVTAYADNPNTPLGKSPLARLFHAEAMWKNTYDSKTINQALDEILKKTTHLAWDANSAKKPSFKGRSGYGKHELDQARLFYQNPVAVAQVLIQYPEYADEACKLIKIMENDVEWRNFYRGTLKFASYGGLIIGGALTLTGIGAEAGAPILGLSAEGLALTNVVIDTVTLSSQVIDNRIQHSEYSQQLNSNSTALAAHTGGDVESLLAAKKGLSETDKEFSAIVFNLVVSKFVRGTTKLVLASRVMKESKFGTTMLRLQKNLSHAPEAQSGLIALDYLCGSLTNDFGTACENMISALQDLPEEKQIEILSDKTKIKEFAASHGIKEAPPEAAPKNSNFVDHVNRGETKNQHADPNDYPDRGLHDYWQIKEWERNYGEKFKRETNPNGTSQVYVPKEAFGRNWRNVKAKKVTIDGKEYAVKTDFPSTWEDVDRIKASRYLKESTQLQQTKGGNSYREGWYQGVHVKQWVTIQDGREIPGSIYPLDDQKRPH
jgi:hypothetical protein